MKLPPTRNHHQLANWINAHKLVDDRGRPVAAHVERIRTSTDRKIRDSRLRWPGKGRHGLRLEIWLQPLPFDQSLVEKPLHLPHEEARLYRHTSSETYRRHTEARAWVEQNLRKAS